MMRFSFSASLLPLAMMEKGAHFEWCFITVNIAQHPTEIHSMLKKTQAGWAFFIEELINNHAKIYLVK